MWRRLEEYLYDKHVRDFSATEYAHEMGFDYVAEATNDIQSYLRAQRRKKSETLYVLRRVPTTRTRNARWKVGARSADARQIGKALSEDTKVKVYRAFMPDLVRIRALNPKAAKLTEAQIDMVIDGALKILEAAAQGIHSDDEE